MTHRTLLKQPAQAEVAALDAIDTPALVLDVAKLDRNVARLRQHLRSLGVAFRPHVKTTKSIDVARRLRAVPDGSPTQAIGVE
jgi:D-serine deaminase-like pyridoxal phosphate-dependent protein